MGILDGVRVVEIAGIGPGPFCGMLLADLGADVIVVERPGSGAARPRPGYIVNRGKRSIELDVKAPAAVDAVLRLVAGADALIEGMRPGVMERLGLGPDACLARNIGDINPLADHCAGPPWRLGQPVSVAVNANGICGDYTPPFCQPSSPNIALTTKNRRHEVTRSS